MTAAGRPGDARRVLILPVEIAGYAARLQEGFAELGWDASVLDLSGDPYGYGGQPPHDRGSRALVAVHRLVRGRSVLLKAVAAAATAPLRLLAAWRAVHNYDALVYLYGRTLVGGLDLRWARARGVRTVAVFLGSDSRPPYISGFSLNVEGEVDWPGVRRSTRRVAARVRATERYADSVICHPASAQLLGRPFVNWLAVGMPVDAPVATRSVGKAGAGPLRVVHAPSRRRQKGSDLIEAALARIRDDGADLELVSLHGVQNHVVRAELARADLVVDELYSDTVMGGLGVEAASAGAPAVVFGHASNFLRPMVERLGVPYEQYGSSDRLEQVLRRAVGDPAWRSMIAGQTADYVRLGCSPASVAARIARLLAGQVPGDWLVSPTDVDYVLGFGMPVDMAEARLIEYVRRYGESALHLPEGSGARAAVRAVLGRDPLSRRR